MFINPFGPLIATIVLWAWLPIVVALFATRKPREATILSFLFAWIFLPTIGFDLPGLPDYTKMTAATLGTFASICLFDSGRLLALRPRWYDWPMAIWCFCPMIPAITNNQGPYDGASACIQEVIGWGIPYVIGRVYLGDADGMIKLSRGIAIAGLIYIPFLIVEMRLSPVFDLMVYGLFKWEGTRFGVFRPHVFLSNGLELGMWMACTCFAAIGLWSSGAVKRLWGWPFSWLTSALFIMTFAIRATGAFVLLIMGLVAIRVARSTRGSWPAWALILMSPVYCSTRLTGLFSGNELVTVVGALTGDGERVNSIAFRFQQEDIMMRSAMKRPLFGWARAGGFNRTAQGTNEAISDGFWIITLGRVGLLGLSSLCAIHCLPMILVIRRFPVRTWNDPDVVAPVSMGVLLCLCMIDNLSNAMPNPIYALISGGLMALPGPVRGARRGGGLEALAEAGELRELGRPAEAAEAYRTFLSRCSDPGEDPDDPIARDEHDAALEGLATSLFASGRFDEADGAFEELVASRLGAAARDHDPLLIRDLAAAHEGRARTLARLGRHDRALPERLKAVDLWSGLASAYPGEPSLAGRRASSLNDLAWLLASDLPAPLRDPIRAAELAAEAARIAPGDPACWNTLGVALYRSGDHRESLEALVRSVELGPPGGTAFDHYFLAMASYRGGDLESARAWVAQGDSWAARQGGTHPALAAFRAEALDLLGTAGLGRSLTRS